LRARARGACQSAIVYDSLRDAMARGVLRTAKKEPSFVANYEFQRDFGVFVDSVLQKLDLVAQLIENSSCG
jgi:hypothetical protein